MWHLGWRRQTLHWAHRRVCEWRERLPELRPYDIVGSGEVALYRLELVLNEVGNAFLMLDRFLETGERPGGPNPEGLSSATTLGLKGVALRYFWPACRGRLAPGPLPSAFFC